MHLCTPYIRHAGFWNESRWHAGRSPSSLARRTRRPCFPTRMSNLDSSDHRTLFHFWPTGQKGASGPCSHMASFLHFRALIGICRWHGRLCLSTEVSVSIPEPIYVNDRIMHMSDAMSSVGPKITGIQQRSSALSLTQRFLQFLWIFWWCYAL